VPPNTTANRPADHLAGAPPRGASPSTRLTLAAVALLGCLAASGCQRALFPREADRTQYDRYDRIRQEYASQYRTDEFGRRKPNLRGRLSPDR